MKIFLTPLLLFTFSVLVFAQESKCSPPKANENTHWVGNLQVVVVEKKSLKQLHGTVFTPNGTPLENALVEVFTNPEYLLTERPTDKRGAPEQVRVAACQTSANGKFEFINLPPGEYELRSSSGDFPTGWNVTQIYVVVKPNGRKKELRVEMSLGV